MRKLIALLLCLSACITISAAINDVANIISDTIVIHSDDFIPSRGVINSTSDIIEENHRMHYHITIPINFKSKYGFRVELTRGLKIDREKLGRNLFDKKRLIKDYHDKKIFYSDLYSTLTLYCGDSIYAHQQITTFKEDYKITRNRKGDFIISALLPVGNNAAANLPYTDIGSTISNVLISNYHGNHKRYDYLKYSPAVSVKPRIDNIQVSKGLYTSLDSLVIEIPKSSVLTFCYTISELTENEIAQPYIDNANDLYSKRNFNDAIKEIQYLLNTLEIPSFEAYYILANSYAEMGYIKSAIIELGSAILIAPDEETKESCYYQRALWKKEVNDDTFIDDLAHAGLSGKLILQELGVTQEQLNSTSTSNQEVISIPNSVLTAISFSDSSKKLSASEIYARCNPSVFTIYTSDAQGSGFFIGDNGLAISNYHVFKGNMPNQIMALLPNGGLYQIKEILAYSEDEDFVIFRVAGNGFSYIPISRKNHEIGNTVYAIGSPKGEKNTLSQGVISGLGNSETTFKISVPIDHGSSGGVLLNEYGEAIGITSGGRDDTHANLNYAIDLKIILTP